MRMCSTSGTFEPPKSSGTRFLAAPSLPPSFTPPIAAACDCTDPASGVEACLASLGDSRAALLAKWSLAHINGRVPVGSMTTEQAAAVTLFTYAQPGDDDPDAQLAAAAEAAARSNFEDDGSSGVGSIAERVNTWMAHRAAYGRDALEDDRWLGFVAHLCAALRLLPTIAGRVFRGVHAAHADIKGPFAPGSRIIWPGFVSATASIEQARSVTRGTGTLFTIEAKCVHPVGGLAVVDEQELIFEPNSEFVVKSASGSAGVVTVELIQAETRTPLLGAPGGGALNTNHTSRSRHRHHHHHKKSGGGGGSGVDTITGDPASGPDTSPVRIRSRTRSGEDVVSSAPTTMTLTQLCTLAPSSMPASTASPVAVTVTAIPRQPVLRKHSDGVPPTISPSVSSPALVPRPSHSPVSSSASSPSPSISRSQTLTPKRSPVGAHTVTMWSAARSYVKVRSLRCRPNQRFITSLHPSWCRAVKPATNTETTPNPGTSPVPSPRMPQVALPASASASPSASPSASTPTKRSARRKIAPSDV